MRIPGFGDLDWFFKDGGPVRINPESSRIQLRLRIVLDKPILQKARQEMASSHRYAEKAYYKDGYCSSPTELPNFFFEGALRIIPPEARVIAKILSEVRWMLGVEVEFSGEGVLYGLEIMRDLIPTNPTRLIMSLARRVAKQIH